MGQHFLTQDHYGRSLARNFVGTIGLGYHSFKSSRCVFESYFWKLFGESVYLFAWYWSESVCFLRFYEPEVEVGVSEVMHYALVRFSVYGLNKKREAAVMCVLGVGAKKVF